MNKRVIAGILLSAVLFIGTPVLIMSAPDTAVAVKLEVGQKDVPYVPTPEDIVDRMLALAKITEKDLLVDLGCGDGRIVIGAAKQGCRAVGIDIDPERINESRQNAKDAKLSDRAKFIQQDLFEADLKEATVVTMYLLPSVNMRLRPKLLAELKPGSRVVSHAFDLGRWEPDKADGIVYFWVVPANVTGTWSWEESDTPVILKLRQKFQKAQGSLLLGGKTIPIRKVSLRGGQIRFIADHELNGKTVPIRYSGQVEGNKISGKSESGDGNPSTWNAVRDPLTRIPLDR